MSLITSFSKQSLILFETLRKYMLPKNLKKKNRGMVVNNKIEKCRGKVAICVYKAFLQRLLFFINIYINGLTFSGLSMTPEIKLIILCAR